LLKKQKSILAIFLIGVFTFNTLGFCLFSTLILIHKKSVFNKILSGDFKSEELYVLEESQISNARWVHQHEFEWKGEMYDVVKTKTVDGRKSYSCKKDSKEDLLKKQQRKASEKSSRKKMVELLKIFVQANHFQEPLLRLNTTNVESGIFVNKCSSKHLKISSPPPKG
jgi:hypothetical protein